LDVIGRRDDGFHELETVIVPIQLGDWISLTATPPDNDGHPGEIVLDVRDCRWQGSAFHFPGEAVPRGADNLIVRALDLLRQRSQSRFGARVELVKRVPLAAGLGGGSSDAAAALRLANHAWRLNWRRDRLIELAAELGSDVPFFLSGGAAICRGRGQHIERLPSMPPLHVVVVKPPVSLKTGDVYRAHDALCASSNVEYPAPSNQQVGVQPSRLSRHTLKRELQHATSSITSTQLASGRWGDLRRWMCNRLQAAAATLTPWVHQVSGVFDQLDFVAHQLTGSGSAYFGVCRHAQHARRLAAILRTRQLGLVYATRSCQ
jgi:4-diphosphocytidyl-2-C-methyl-D-erythritol kinase